MNALLNSEPPHRQAGAVESKRPVATSRALDIFGLTTQFPGENGPITVVDDVSFWVGPGETLAIVGESGSGKSMTFISALGLVKAPGRITAGKVTVQGRSLTELPAEQLRSVRGKAISMVFQDPLTALNPVFTIGQQIVEVLRAHQRISRKDARKRAIELLARVQIPEPHRRVDDYPHQLSGGMRQRVMIAMAVALDPKVLIADEPTTALDVTVQAQILELLVDLQRENGMAMVLITHDLGLVARHADRVAVMYAGRVVESGTLDDIFSRVRHPYTHALFQSVPRLTDDAEQPLPTIDGQPPNVALLPPGCAFEPRCFLGKGRSDCRSLKPLARTTDTPEHRSACLHWSEMIDHTRRAA